MRFAAAILAGVVALLAACASTPAKTAGHPTGPCSLVIHLKGLSPAPGSGPVPIAVWSSPQTFMQRGKWYETREVAADAVASPVRIDGLEPGTYAVSAFHDVARTGTLRRGMLGIPADPWAVSGMTSALAPPTWSRACFEVKPGVNELTLQFMGGSRTP